MSADELSIYATHTGPSGAASPGNAASAARSGVAYGGLTHHANGDGSGYPVGLAGTDIPLEGRITAVADVFDALSSRRPYKPALPLDKCFAILEEGRGKHFDPTVLDAFFARRGEVVAVQVNTPKSTSQPTRTEVAGRNSDSRVKMQAYPRAYHTRGLHRAGRFGVAFAGEGWRGGRIS